MEGGDRVVPDPGANVQEPGAGRDPGADVPDPGADRDPEAS